MPKRVLIIEDNLSNLELTSELIQAKGHQVICATSGNEALSIARAEQPDLILLDIQLPGVDGLTVARALKAEPATKEIPIVGISAHAMPEDEARALQAGCIAYLRKPLDTRHFLDLMERLLGGARR
jgi:CheY-like chemotaxis protein